MHRVRTFWRNFFTSTIYRCLRWLARRWFFAAIGYPDLEQVIIISGMAAVAASVIGAPITSVLIVLELTGSYEYGVAAMVAVIISSLVTYRAFGLSFLIDNSGPRDRHASGQRVNRAESAISYDLRAHGFCQARC